MSSIIYAYGETFDERLSKYKICCGGTHVSSASLTIGLTEILWAIAAMALTIMCFVMLPSNTTLSHQIFLGIFIGEIILETIGLIMGVVLIISVKRRKLKLISVHLIWQCCTIVLTLGAIICTIYSTATKLYFIAGISDEEENGTKLSEGIVIGLGVILSVTFSFMLILEIWFLFIVSNCRQYLKDKLKYRSIYNASYSFALEP